MRSTHRFWSTSKPGGRNSNGAVSTRIVMSSTFERAHSQLSGAIRRIASASTTKKPQMPM